MRSAAAWVATGVAITTCFAPSCSAAFPAASTLHGYVTWPSMITAIRPASFFTGRSVRYRIRSWLTRARDSSMALASLSISAPLGWKSGSISDGADSAMAPIGARLDPSLMNAATSTSNWAPIAFAALAAISTYGPGFLNTAACRSAISYIDGDKGILRYRGYPIEQLAERSTFLETAYLLLHGELPSAAELDSWVYNVTHHTIVHESIKKFIDGFHHDAHPMGMFVSTVAALSTFYPEAKLINNETSRWNQIFRLIAKAPTLAAFAYRHSVGMPYAYPDNDLSYTGNFLNMMFKATEVKYTPNKTLEHALDVLFILHADHEQNCSTNAMRGVGSSHADPYSAMAAAAIAEEEVL